MIVDPSTGLPIEDGAPIASRVSGAAAMSAMNRMGMGNEDVPLLYDLAASLPSSTHTTMWNMGRVSNTVISGGTVDRTSLLHRMTHRSAANAGRGGFITQGTAQTFGPRHMTRLTRAGNIDPTERSMYSPFGTLSSGGNFVVRQAGRSEFGRNIIARTMGENFDPKVDAFSRGTFGRMTAMARLGTMNAGDFSRAARNMNRTLADMSPHARQSLIRTLSGPGSPTAVARERAAVRAAGFSGMEDLIRGPLGEGWEMAYKRGAYQGVLGGTIRGSVSGRVAGFYQGSQAARIAGQTGLESGITGLQTAAREMAERTGSTAFRTGVEGGVNAFRGGNMAARVVGSRGASVALRAAGPVGMVLLAHDVAMMAGKVVARTGRTLVEAGNNLVAPLNKGVMGGTYTDNAVAATARQRGVMAISNSRLNMRSVLGSEASMLAAHFG